MIIVTKPLALNLRMVFRAINHLDWLLLNRHFGASSDLRTTTSPILKSIIVKFFYRINSYCGELYAKESVELFVICTEVLDKPKDVK